LEWPPTALRERRPVNADFAQWLRRPMLSCAPKTVVVAIAESAAARRRR